ncbi:MAG: HEAT repeat domain-containing protein [Planctomycetota bacterium]
MVLSCLLVLGLAGLSFAVPPPRRPPVSPRLGVEELAAQLKDQDVPKRIEAARRLSRATIHEDIRAAAVALAGALSDESADVRLAAANALATLLPSASQAEYVLSGRRRGSSGQPYRQVLRALMAAAGDSEVDVQLASLVVLGRFRAPEAIDVIARAIESDNAGVRAAAVKSAMETRDPRFAPKILEALDDEDVEVRRAAVGAVAELRLRKAADRLIEMLEDTECEFPGEVARALGTLKIFKAVPALAKALVNPEACEGAAEALAAMPTAEAVDALIGGLKAESPRIRRTCAIHLRLVGSPKVVKPLAEALKDEDEGVAVCAAASLGELRNPRAVGALIDAMNGPGSELPPAAASALGRMRSRRAVSELIKALSASSAALRAAAAESLGLLRDRRAIKPLRNLLKDPDPQVRTKAGQALWNGFHIPNEFFGPPRRDSRRRP